MAQSKMQQVKSSLGQYFKVVEGTVRKTAMGVASHTSGELGEFDIQGIISIYTEPSIAIAFASDFAYVLEDAAGIYSYDELRSNLRQHGYDLGYTAITETVATWINGVVTITPVGNRLGLTSVEWFTERFALADILTVEEHMSLK